MALAPGTRIGVYDIVGPLGAGGMGEVYRATDVHLKRAVALKMLPDALANDADRVARFQREAELLATPAHPHIAAIYGPEASTPTRALVLECVEGEPLADRLARGPLPVREALDLARQIADALDYAHSAGCSRAEEAAAPLTVMPELATTKPLTRVRRAGHTLMASAGRVAAFVIAALPAGAALLMLLAIPLVARAQITSVSPRPNILWILVEDASPDIGAYGDSYARTPTLDRLARDGMRFTRAFSTAPVCAPSRSTLFTGMYASSTGALHMRSTAVPPPYVKGLGEYLRAAGYFTFNREKTDYNISATPVADNDGARLPRAVPLGPWDESGPSAHWRHRDTGQPFFGVISPQVTHESRLFMPADQFAKETAHLKAEDRHDPARGVLPPYYPDTPVARATWTRYYDMWTEADYQVADILRELDEDRLAANTVVIFASDHGRGFPRAKRWAYDSGVRVPLIVRWPGHLASGTVREDLVSFIDLPPTTLALAGVPVPKHFQGQVFLGPNAAPPREFVFVHRDRMDTVPDTIRAVRDQRYKYIRNFFPDRPYAHTLTYAEQVPMLQEWRRSFAEGLLKGPQLLFFAPRKPAEELYDTEADPHEIVNLADRQSEQTRLERFRTALDAWMQATGDLGLVPEPELKERMRPGGRWGTAAAPEVTPPGGTFANPVEVRLSCATDGATIVYTTEVGDSPHWRLYSRPITISTAAELRVKCARLGYQDSVERRATFAIAP